MGRKVDIKFTTRFLQQTTRLFNKRRYKNLKYRCLDDYQQATTTYDFKESLLHTTKIITT